LTDHFDALETRDPAQRETALFAQLPEVITRAQAQAPGWAAHLANVDAADVTSRSALASLPVLRKSELIAKQAEAPPFGGLTTTPAGALGRLFMSPGPIFEPEGTSIDWWRSARALYAAGFRKGDIVHNTFSYHMTPGGWILDAGARALGCAVIPAGPGNTEQQIELIRHLQPTAYIGVPDYLKIILDKAAEAGIALDTIKSAMVSGGPLFPSLRQEYADRGIRVVQCYATADLGIVAYETPAMEGMVVDEGAIVEIVRPGTGDPVPDGEVGEVVVTTLNRDYPMIRLATGDLSAVLSGVSPCGRTNMRIKGWLGRADQTAKVKGMFVRPEQIAEIAARHPQALKLRLVITRQGEQDAMELQVETGEGDASGLPAAIAETLQAVTKLRGTVSPVAIGSLPNDGKVISDERDFGS
jgi:phenylacetate-CoA ligase